MVALDRAGNVIRPAILWNDQRTGKAVDAIETVMPRQTLIQRTGNLAITGFQLPKLVWLQTEEPQAYTQVQQVLLPKDYLGYVLTGELVTEPSDASGTGCFNLATRQWDRDLLVSLNLNPAWFPTVIESTAIAGRLKPDLAAHVGLPVGLPVVAGGGDNAAAAIGLGISSSHLNRGSLSIGTSGVIFVPCDRPVPESGRASAFILSCGWRISFPGHNAGGGGGTAVVSRYDRARSHLHGSHGSGSTVATRRSSSFVSAPPSRRTQSSP
jgi:xylulokinase